MEQISIITTFKRLLIHRFIKGSTWALTPPNWFNVGMDPSLFWGGKLTRLRHSMRQGLGVGGLQGRGLRRLVEIPRADLRRVTRERG